MYYREHSKQVIIAVIGKQHAFPEQNTSLNWKYLDFKRPWIRNYKREVGEGWPENLERKLFACMCVCVCQRDAGGEKERGAPERRILALEKYISFLWFLVQCFQMKFSFLTLLNIQLSSAFRIFISSRLITQFWKSKSNF